MSTVKIEEKIELYEGGIHHTLEMATKIANEFSKGNDVWGNPFPECPKSYHTSVKVNSDDPEYCWQVTNRFDPRVSV